MTQPIQDYNPLHRDHAAPARIIPGLLARLTAQEYVLGLDLSHWNTLVDFAQVKAAGYEYVILKATEHTTYVDPLFNSRWQQALDAGLIVGTYHFLRCNFGGGNQAEHHLRTIAPLLDATGGCIIPPACDIETTDGVNTQTRQECINRWFDYMRGKIGRSPLCYSSPYLWRTIAENMSLDCVGWVAHWTSASAPSWPGGWAVNKRLFWQYGTTNHTWVQPVPGVTGECDVNRFFGTLADLRAFVGIQEMTTQEKVDVLWTAHPELH